MKLSSYKDIVGPLYFLEPDLKGQFPKHPKFTPGVIPFNASKSTLQFMGSYTSFALYNVINLELMKSFISLCDGNHTLKEILQAMPEVDEQDKRNLLAMLFRNGLLEDGSNQKITTDAAFFSRVIDHTRLNSNGQQAFDRVNQTNLSIIGPQEIAASLAQSFQSSKLNSVVINEVNADVDVYLVFKAGSTNYGLLNALQTKNDKIMIWLNLDQNMVEFGPILNTMTDLILSTFIATQNADSEKLTETQLHQIVYRTVLFISKCNINKIHGYTAVIGLDAFADTKYLVRSKYLWSEDSANGPYQANKELMDHYATISVPPIDYLGGKVHEHHSSPMNLAAYKEKPMELYSREKIDFQVQDESIDEVADISMLKDILNKTFGYRHLEFGPKRIAPSGGDLGVTEAIITGIEGTSSVYRYHGISNSLEILRNEDTSDLSEITISIYFYSNVEKAKRKYGSFGENLVWLDAGISLNYIQNLSALAGYRMSWQRCEDCAPYGMQFLRNKTHKFLYCIKLLRASSLDTTEVRQNLNTLIDVRIAARNFSPEAVSHNVLEDLIEAARSHFLTITSNQHELNQTICENISLLVLESGKITKYRLNEVTQGKVISDRTASEFVDLNNLINQTTLSSSPLKFVVVLDMHQQVIPIVDLNIYKNTLSIASSVVMELWFEVLAQGLIACPAGGLSPYSLLNKVDPHHRDFLVLFTLCVGEENKDES